jgi:hypothetical protein
MGTKPASCFWPELAESVSFASEPRVEIAAKYSLAYVNVPDARSRSGPKDEVSCPRRLGLPRESVITYRLTLKRLHAWTKIRGRSKYPMVRQFSLRYDTARASDELFPAGTIVPSATRRRSSSF